MTHVGFGFEYKIIFAIPFITTTFIFSSSRIKLSSLASQKYFLEIFHLFFSSSSRVSVLKLAVENDLVKNTSFIQKSAFETKTTTTTKKNAKVTWLIIAKNHLVSSVRLLRTAKNYQQKRSSTERKKERRLRTKIKEPTRCQARWIEHSVFRSSLG